MRHKILILYFLAIVLGVIVGLVGSSFRLAIDLLISLLAHWVSLFAGQGWLAGIFSGSLSLMMVLAAFLAVKHIAPEAGGSGVQEIEGALLHLRPVFWKRLVPIKYVFGILAISSNMILGREGPTIHVGGNLGEMLGHIFKLSRRRRDSLIAAGAASGLAVAFNAPLAGVIFVMEEMRNQFNYSFTSFNVVVITCIVATVMMDLIIGTQATIPMSVFQFPALDALWLFVLFGFIVGLVGTVFNKGLMTALAWVDGLSFQQKLLYVSLIGFVIGYATLFVPAATGGGMSIIHQALTLAPGFNVLCLLFVVRFIGTIACYSTGIPGGIFAPVLALGTLLGLGVFQVFVFLHLDFVSQPGIFAVAGMAALFAAITRAPITGGVLVVEMTQNYALIFPVMITCLCATIVLQLARNQPIYTQLLDRTLRNSRINRGASSL